VNVLALEQQQRRQQHTSVPLLPLTSSATAFTFDASVVSLHSTRTEEDSPSTTQAAADPQLQPGPSSSTDVASSSASSSGSSFRWLEHWYPVHVVAMADASRPHAIQLLGKQLVLWRDGQGQWQCMEDACPHR
jgi:hypothetical protein